MHLPIGIHKWAKEIVPNFRLDILAGLTLWAMIVPEAVAYANLAGAPNAAAGLYGIMIVLPIYAIFASSRMVVATSTSAISVTMAGFLAVMSSQSQGAFMTLVLGASLAYLLFYFFKLGFVANFISEPVSRGFMFGLAIFIIVGQLPKLFGLKKASGNTVEQIIGLVQNLPNSNWIALGFSVIIFAIIIGSERISRKIPGGLLAIAIAIIICFVFNAQANWGLTMVGALPEGLPTLVLPEIAFSDLAIVIPASLGLVILGASESTVLAESMAMQKGEKVNIDQQFFAFGLANLAGSFFGSLLGTGSTSSTLVNQSAGAKTLMSTVWAALATMLTILFLTGLFAYLPELFLGVLIIHAVYHMLKFRAVLQVRKFSVAEFNLAILALLGVLLFDVLYGLLLAMIINLLYLGFVAAKVQMVEYGYAKNSPHVIMPLGLNSIEKAPAGVLVLGLIRGQVFYASAQQVFEQMVEFIEQHPEANEIVISAERLAKLDYTSANFLHLLEIYIREHNKKLYLTNIHTEVLMKQLQAENLDPKLVSLSTDLDISKLGKSKPKTSKPKSTTKPK